MDFRHIKNPRSTVLFTVGLIGIGFETFYSLQYHQTPDSGLVVLFGAMIGLPAFLKQDKDSKNGNGLPKPPSPGSDADSNKESPSDTPR